MTLFDIFFTINFTRKPHIFIQANLKINLNEINEASHPDEAHICQDKMFIAFTLFNIICFVI